jgi:hypothetical protein
MVRGTGVAIILRYRFTFVETSLPGAPPPGEYGFSDRRKSAIYGGS